MGEQEAWHASFLDRGYIPSARAMVKVLNSEKVSQEVFKSALADVLKVILKQTWVEDATETKDATLKKLRHGIFSIVVCALRKQVDEKTIARDLSSVNMPKSLAKGLAKRYKKHYPDLVAANKTSAVSTLPTLSNFRWRVNVSISTHALSRAFKPQVMLEPTLSDGSIKTFECSSEKFNLLRYNVSKQLKNMQDLNHHPTLLRIAETENSSA